MFHHIVIVVSFHFVTQVHFFLHFSSSLSHCFTSLAHLFKGNGKNTVCKWLNPRHPIPSQPSNETTPTTATTTYIDQELRVLRKYCSFSSPKCQKRDAKGQLIENICVPTYPHFPKKITLNHCVGLKNGSNGYMYSLQSLRKVINYSLYEY